MPLSSRTVATLLVDTTRAAAGALGRFVRTGDAASLRRTFVDVGRHAFVETGEQRVGHLLAVDQVNQHEGCAVPHLERPLADLRVAAAGLQRGELWWERVACD